MAIDEILRKYISEEKGITFDDIGNDTSLLESGLIDSVNMVQILSFIEEQFGIKVEDNELIPENFDTINSIFNLIKGKLPDNSMNDDS
jgi:acyl carrier protein